MESERGHLGITKIPLREQSGNGGVRLLVKWVIGERTPGRRKKRAVIIIRFHGFLIGRQVDELRHDTGVKHNRPSRTPVGQ